MPVVPIPPKLEIVNVAPDMSSDVYLPSLALIDTSVNVIESVVRDL